MELHLKEVQDIYNKTTNLQAIVATDRAAYDLKWSERIAKTPHTLDSEIDIRQKDMRKYDILQEQLSGAVSYLKDLLDGKGLF